MRISVLKVGGLLGKQRPAAQVDTDALSAEEQRELHALLDAAGFWQLPADLPASPQARDAQGTILEVQDGDRQHSVGFELPSAPPELRELVSKVRAFSAGSRGRT